MTHRVLRLIMCCKPLTSSATRKFSTALANKPQAKAVPQGSVPVEVWKLCMPEILPRIRRLFAQHLQGDLSLPTTWRDCHLYLLPKPSKPAKLPASLRPIALQCPLGKCLARVIQRRLLEHIMPALESTAQYAYLPGPQYADCTGADRSTLSRGSYTPRELPH